MRYGWYYEGGSVQGDGENAWAVLAEAVEQAAEDERSHAVMVGEMVEHSAGDYLTAEDIVSLAEDGRMTADYLVETISERHGERVWDGQATLASADAKPALRRIVQAHRSAEDAAADVIAWAHDHVSLDPHISCDGRPPLPVEYVEGEWRWGCMDPEPPEPAAVVTYAQEPSPETGHEGWVWWALGKMGEAPTLREAMAAAERVIAKEVGLG